MYAIRSYYAAPLVSALVAMVVLPPALWMSTERIRAQTAGDSHQVTREQYERWKTELSNWGRWGADDEVGALNLITPAKPYRADGC